MDEPRVSEMLEEIAALEQSVSPELRALHAAIAVEDVLGLVIPDEMLDPEHLGNPEAIRRLIDLVAAL